MFFKKDTTPYRDYGMLVLRLAVAAVFLYHGFQKWGMWTAAPEGMSSGMLTLMRALSIAEPLAGISMVIGLLTPVSAVGIMIVMLSAMYMKISGGLAFGAWEIDLSMFSAALAILLAGPGAISMDAKMKK